MAPAATSSVMLEQQFLQLCDEQDWEVIQLKRTSKNTVDEQAPLQHNLEDGARAHVELQLQKQGFLPATYRTSSFYP